jgi:dTDP-4-dehydrorhamnose reductase
MRALVVGGGGLIGTALCAALEQNGHRAFGTQRRDTTAPDYLDLARDPLGVFGDGVSPMSFQCVYFVAAVTGFANCEGNPQAHRVNVDAPIALADFLTGKYGVFSVFVSSEAVEWSSSAYARHKMLVETHLRARFPERAAIVRPTKINAANVTEFSRWLARIGEHTQAGVHRWPDVR